MYFPDRGCLRTLRTLYVYATGTDRPERHSGGGGKMGVITAKMVVKREK